MSNVRVRIAPSPTGLLHLGTARTALFNYIFAKQQGGKFLIRIEDTDKVRSEKKYEDDILEGLSWLGLHPDEPLIRQSERTELYKNYIKQLLDSGKAYVSQEEGGERDTVIRFKNPNKKVVFQDLIRGDVEIDTTDIGDFVIAKDEETPLYHLVVVVDDLEMNITHVIRGEDHISNTPRQILIQEALGVERPTYAHLPLILAPDKSKLSKRHGATSVTEYKENGYVKEALVNFMALLGWHPEGDEEVFTLETLLKEFDFSKIQKGGAMFDIDKLNYLNRQHLKQLSNIQELIEERIPEGSLLKNTEAKELRNELLLERINVLSDITTLHKDGGEFDLFMHEPHITQEILIDKKTNPAPFEVKEHLAHIVSILETLSTIDSPEAIKEAIWDYATEKGRGAVLWPMRVALSGKEKSPDPFTLTVLLGKNVAISRLKKAHDTIEA